MVRKVGHECMNDRFLDDANIKKSVQAINPQLQAALERTKQLKEGINQQISTLSPEDKQKLIQPVRVDKKQIVNNIQEKLDLPKPTAKPTTRRKRTEKVQKQEEEPVKTNILDSYDDNDQISRTLAVNNIDNMAVNQLITDTVRQSPPPIMLENDNKEPDIIPLDRPDRIIKEDDNNSQMSLSQEQIYQNEVQRILQQHPELKPEQNAGININMNMSNPSTMSSNISTTISATSTTAKVVIGPLKLSKDLLLQKQADALNALENARIELEIYSRMSSEKDELLRTNLKIKDWTTKVKEAELRLSIIANLLAGR